MTQLSGRFTDNEIDFIRDVLDEHGDYLQEILRQAIQDKDLIDTGELESNINTKVNAKSDLINPRLSLTFDTYGRFIELRYFKKSKNTNAFLAPNTNQLLWGARNTKRKKKNTQWYSRNVYGSLNRLIGILMYEYQDWVIAKEKAKFILINKNIPT